MRRLRGACGAVFVLLAAGLIGCSPAVHKSLDPGLSRDVDGLLCRSIIQNEEISVHVVVYTGLFEGGLIGKAITANRGKDAEERITPLLEQTADVDFRRLYWDALQETMRGVGWIQSIKFEPTTVPVNVTKDEIQDQYVLNLTTSYELTPDCLALMVVTHAALFYPGQEKAVYHGWLSYFSEPTGDLTEEEAIQAWAADGAARYRSLLREGVVENMRMLRADLLDRGEDAGWQPGEKKTLYFQRPVQKAMRDLYKTGSFKGEVLADDGTRLLFRFSNGNIWSLARSTANEVKPVVKRHGER